MRPDELYLRDLLDAAGAIERFLEGVEEPRFLRDEILQSAVLQKLAIIGEAAARISAELKSTYPRVEWRTIAGLRNVVVHEYFAVSWETIWITARLDVPDLASRVRSTLNDLKGRG